MGRNKKKSSEDSGTDSEKNTTKSPTKSNSKLVRIPGETLAIFVSEKEENYRKQAYSGKLIFFNFFVEF